MSQPSTRQNGVLGIAFQVCRTLQFITLIATIGLSAHLVSGLMDHTQQPPTQLTITLCTTCFAVLYIIITYALYFDNKLPYHLAALTDTLFLIALTTINIIIGAPLSSLTCKASSSSSSSSSSSTTPINAFDPTAAFTDVPLPTTTTTPIDPAYLTPESGTVVHLLLRARDAPAAYAHMDPIGYGAWISAEGGTCVMMKAVWGLVFVLMVLFVASTVVSGLLWRRERRAGKRNVQVEGVVAGKEFGGYV